MANDADPKDNPLLKWARENTPQHVGDPNDTLEKWKERTPYPASRMLHKEILHSLIRMFVGSYKQTATPDAPDTADMCDKEREDLARGEHLKTDLREKWAVERAVERFERDDRTIREAINPSARSDKH
jgi:hypothetical protein